MDRDKFKKLYECEWKADPLLNETIAYLRYATPKEIATGIIEGWLDRQMVRDAKQAIRREAERLSQ